jgi:hypothetical protein
MEIGASFNKEKPQEIQVLRRKEKRDISQTIKKRM